MSNQPINHDKFFRGSLAKKEIAEDFLKAHLPAEITKRIDFSSLRLELSTFIDNNHKEYRNDILYSVDIDHQQGYIYTLIEHQSSVQKIMSFRLLHYACCIWKQHMDKKGEQSIEKLPTIIPLVVYNGKVSPYSASQRLMDCFEEPALIQRFLLDEFRLIDLTVIPDEELVQHQRAAFLELLGKHVHRRALFPVIRFMEEAEVFGKISHVEGGDYIVFGVKYLVMNSEADDVGEVVDFIGNTVSEKRGEIMTMAEKWIEQGMQQGVRQGAHQRELEIANILALEGFSADKIKKYTGVETEDLITSN